MPVCCQCKQNSQNFTSSQLKKTSDKRTCKTCQKDEFGLLVQWVKEANSEIVKGCKVNHDNGRLRGLVTDVDIHANERMLHVPLRCMMTEQEAKKRFPTCNVHTALAFYLLEEVAKGESSFFAPYLKTLPCDFSHFGVFLPKEERKHLLPCFIYDMLEARVYGLEQEWKHSQDVYPCSLEQFKWARTIVITRVFQCGVQGSCLVPIADMMNHDAYPNVGWAFDETKQGFVMYALSNIRGEQALLDSYGKKCNSRFYVNYGFVLSNNEIFNQCVFYLPQLAPSDPNHIDDGFIGGFMIQVPQGYVRCQIPIIHGQNPEAKITIQAVIHLARCCVGTKTSGEKRFQNNPHEYRALQLIAQAAEKRLKLFDAQEENEVKRGEMKTLEFYVELGRFAQKNQNKLRVALGQSYPCYANWFCER